MCYILVVLTEDSDVVPVMEFVPRLFQRKGRAILSFTEMRDAVPAAAMLFLLVKEGFVGPVNAFGYILNRLGAEFLPVFLRGTFAHLGQMHLELIGGKVLVVHLVVPTVKGNTVVVDFAMIVDEPVQMAQALASAYFVLVGHDDLLFFLRQHSSPAFHSVILPFDVGFDSFGRDIPGGRHEVGWCPEGCSVISLLDQFRELD